VGVIAQSIGGGGGIAQAYGVSGTGKVTLGAAGGATGNGGAVTLSSAGAISTTGIGAHGILAQSIGGGGGFVETFDSAGTPLNLVVRAGVLGGGGNGSAVSVTTTGIIATTGAGAYGIIAQSIGGGGGVVGGGVFANSQPTTGPFAGSVGGSGTASTVTVNSQADVVVTGVDSTAIFAQSADHTGFGGNIGIIISNSTTGTTEVVSGGAGAGNAVRFVGGATNTLMNFGTLTTVAAVDGMTVTGGVGSEAITSFGHMIGSIDLDGGANSIDNKPYNSISTRFSGVFDSGVTIKLGAGNVFTNEGLISPGALLRVLTTNETGNFVQTVTGSCGTFGFPTSTCGYYGLDLEFQNQTADRLNVTGTASVSGQVVVNILNPGLALPGTHEVTILSTAAGETHPNLGLQSQPTAVATYSLTYPNATDIDLQYVINFSPGGLTQNEHAVGNAINAIQTARISPNFLPIAAALFYQPDVATLGRVYDSLSGEGVAAVEQTAIQANDLFHTSISRQAMFWLFDDESSDKNSQTFYKKLGVAERTWRLWATGNGGGSKYSGDPLVGSASMSEIGAGSAAGFDYQVNPNILVGLAIGYGSFSFNVPDRATSGSVNAAQVGAYTALRNNDAYATAILDFDFFDNHESRFAAIPGTALPSLFGTPGSVIPGLAETATGKFGSYSVSGLFEAGYRLRLTGYNVTPFVGTQFTVLQMNRFTETDVAAGSNMLGLSYASRIIESIPAYLGAQVDARTNLGNDYSAYGWLRGAWVHEFEPQRSIDPSFIAAPGFDFVIQGAQPATDMARLDAGAKLNVGEHVSFWLSAYAYLAQTAQSYAGFGGFSVAW
jgi:uncharacterized protein with beta-barrel porin domain